METKYNKVLERTSEGPCKIQKIMSSPAAICLSCRIPGETRYLYLGRGGQCIGLFEFGEQVPSEYRIKDSYLELMRKEFRNWGLIKVDQLDTYLALTFNKNKEKKVLFYSSRGRDVYFAICSQSDTGTTVMRSWEGVRRKGEEISIESVKEDVLEKSKMAYRPTFVSKTTDIKSLLWGMYLIEGREKREKKYKKFLNRKREKIIKDIDKNSRWRLLQEKAMGEIDLSRIRPPFFTVDGIKIRITGKESEGKLKDLLFKKLKKLKRGESIQKDRLNKLMTEIENLEHQRDQVDITFKKVERPIWGRYKQKELKGTDIGTGDIAFFKVEGVSLAIGKTARANDKLRSTWAKSSDTWLHIEGERGSHLIIKTDNLLALSKTSIEGIASALKHYSNYSGDEIPVVYSPVSGLRGVKGTAGAVTIKKPKYLSMKFREDWQEILSSL